MPSDHYPAPQDWESILEPGERLLWTGRPVPGLELRDLMERGSITGAIEIVFGVVWLRMTMGMMDGFANAPPSMRQSGLSQMLGPMFQLLPYVGVLIIAHGCWQLVGRTLWEVLKLRRTWYSLTDRRAFVATGGLGAPGLRHWRLDEM